MNCTLPATRRNLQIAGRTISYLEWPAAGPSALLLHGITSSAATLWQIGGELAQSGRHVIALDMPGHGFSDPSSEHTIPTIAHLVGAVIEALDLRDLLLIGHSWGGATALALAAGPDQARDRIAQVVLIDPLLNLDPGRGAEMLGGFSADVGKSAASLMPALAARNPDWHPCDVHWKALAYEQCRREQVAGLMLHSGTWDVLDALEQAPMPLLFLIADPLYTIIPAATLRDLRRRLPPHASLIDIPGTTHNMLRGAGYAPTMATINRWITKGG